MAAEQSNKHPKYNKKTRVLTIQIHASLEPRVAHGGLPLWLSRIVFVAS